MLLSAFFWTYALMQIPAGWLVDRFDVKWVFAAGFFVWSAATAITGLLHGFAALLIIRVILGLGESVAFPSYSKILGGHFKESRRGFANSMLMAGLALGPALGMWLGGSAVGRFGWRPFFLVLGLAGLLWLPLWSAWMPRRSDAPARPDGHTAGVLDILRQRSAWGTCIGQSSINYYLYFLVTWLPFYLVRGRHLSLEEMANEGGLLFLLSAISAAVSGKLSDRWIQAGASPTVVRKGMMLFGHTGHWHSSGPDSARARPLLYRGSGPHGSVSRNQRLQQLGHLADAGWAADGGPMGGRAEFRWKSCRRSRARAHRTPFGSNRFLRLAIPDHCCCGLDWRAQLVVCGWPSGRSGLGEDSRGNLSIPSLSAASSHP